MPPRWGFNRLVFDTQGSARTSLHPGLRYAAPLEL